MGAYIHHRAVLSLAHRIKGLPIFGIENPLLADDENFPTGNSAPVHLQALVHSVCHSLFTEHMLTGRYGIHRHPVMLAQRGGDDDPIHILVLKQGAVVRIGLCAGEHFQALFQIGLVNIAEGHHFRIGYLLKIGKMVLSSGTWANHAQAYLATRHGCFLVRRTRLHYRKSGEDYAGGSKSAHFAKK